LIIRNFEAYYDERKALKEILIDHIFDKTQKFLIKNFSFDEYENKLPIIGDGIYSETSHQFCVYEIIAKTIHISPPNPNFDTNI